MVERRQRVDRYISLLHPYYPTEVAPVTTDSCKFKIKYPINLKNKGRCCKRPYKTPQPKSDFGGEVFDTKVDSDCNNTLLPNVLSMKGTN